ncbi:MAG TPA: alpha/beta fold hydrolase [Haliangium sp.]|nr:alpha/beta fold hydrolase [Haliangium sp.]
MTPWFRVLKAVPRPRVRLVCFHHAGGSAAVFHDWIRDLPPAIELWAAELPGHGARWREPVVPRLEPLAGAMTPLLVRAASAPMTLFGHSMGAVLAYAVAQRLRDAAVAAEMQLLVAGARPPSIVRTGSMVHELPDEALLMYLNAIGGTPQELLANRELMRLALPTIRADYAAVETWQPQHETPLRIPIEALGGRDDASVPPAALAAWEAHTQGPFSLRWFSGGHFFSHQPAVRSAIMWSLGGRRGGV